MRKKIAVALTAGVAAATVGLGAGAVEARPANPGAGGACVQAGLGTLKDLGLFRDATKKKIDYSTLADPESGPIFAELPEGSFLSLGQVVSLHATQPQLFAWCR